MADCLFDIPNDPCETNNLANVISCQTIFGRLQDQIVVNNVSYMGVPCQPTTTLPPYHQLQRRLVGYHGWIPGRCCSPPPVCRSIMTLFIDASTDWDLWVAVVYCSGIRTLHSTALNYGSSPARFFVQIYRTTVCRGGGEGTMVGTRVYILFLYSVAIPWKTGSNLLNSGKWYKEEETKSVWSRRIHVGRQTQLYPDLASGLNLLRLEHTIDSHTRKDEIENVKIFSS